MKKAALKALKTEVKELKKDVKAKDKKAAIKATAGKKDDKKVVIN